MVLDSKHYVYEVTKVIVFGSYLSYKPKINHADIAVHIEKK